MDSIFTFYHLFEPAHTLKITIQKKAKKSQRHH